MNLREPRLSRYPRVIPKKLAPAPSTATRTGHSPFGVQPLGSDIHPTIGWPGAGVDGRPEGVEARRLRVGRPRLGDGLRRLGLPALVPKPPRRLDPPLRDLLLLLRLLGRGP